MTVTGAKDGLAGVMIFTPVTVLVHWRDTLPLLLPGRVVQGIAAAALLDPRSLSLITHTFADNQQRIRVIGIWSSVSALSLINGPILGGVLVHTTGWEGIFLINIPGWYNHVSARRTASVKVRIRRKRRLIRRQLLQYRSALAV